MTSPESTAAALRAAGVDDLPPAARSYLAGRLARGGVDFDRPCIGGLRELRFGSVKLFPLGIGASKAATPRASFADLEGAARALVSTSYRAAPRDWRKVGDAELAALGNYPICRDGAMPIGTIMDPDDALRRFHGLTPEQALAAGWKRVKVPGCMDCAKPGWQAPAEHIPPSEHVPPSDHPTGPSDKVPLQVKGGGVRYVTDIVALKAGATKDAQGRWNLTTATLLDPEVGSVASDLTAAKEALRQRLANQCSREGVITETPCNNSPGGLMPEWFRGIGVGRDGNIDVVTLNVSRYNAAIHASIPDAVAIPGSLIQVPVRVHIVGDAVAQTTVAGVGVNVAAGVVAAAVTAAGIIAATRQKPGESPSIVPAPQVVVPKVPRSPSSPVETAPPPAKHTPRVHVDPDEARFTPPPADTKECPPGSSWQREGASGELICKSIGGAPELGWWPGFGPSAEAEATFRGLVSDWEAFDRLGVGERILPHMRQDAVDWRAFRDRWLAGDIDSSDLGGQLTAAVANANRVRLELRAANVIDPALGPDLRKGLDVTSATEALKAAVPVDDWAKSVPGLNWLTDPSQKLAAPGFPIPIPRRLLVTGGVVGAGALGLLVWRFLR